MKQKYVRWALWKPDLFLNVTAFVNNTYFTKIDTPKNQILIDIPVENGVTSLKVSSSELIVNAVLYPTDQTVLQLFVEDTF